MQQLRKQPVTLAILLLSFFLLLAQCSTKKDVKKKQIILISVDTLRGDHITPYGYFRDTPPNLAKLANDSVYYPHAYANGCWTMPSHMSLLTGTLPSRHGINKALESIKQNSYPKLNESLKTLAEVLKTRGIKTIKFARLPNKLGFGNGFDINNRVDPFVADYYFEWLLKELEDHREKDFFLFIHTWKVHAPYDSSYYLGKERLSEEVLSYIKHPNKLPNKDKRIVDRYRQFLKKNNLFNVNDCVDMYDGGIYYVDQYIGRLINRAKQLGIYNDLMFIVVSDHGEHFAEHDPQYFYNRHGKDFYEEYIKVPLIIKYPQQAVRAEKRKEPVSLIDVFPTVLNFYDIEIPEFVQGDSLLQSRSPQKQYVVSEATGNVIIERKMIRQGNLKYIVTMENSYERPGRMNWNAITDRRLFNLEDDPLEKKNLYNDLTFRKYCNNLEKILKQILTESSSTKLTTDEVILDKETLEQMKALGYL